MALMNATAAVTGQATITTSAGCRRAVTLAVAGLSTLTTSSNRQRNSTVAVAGVASVTIPTVLFGTTVTPAGQASVSVTASYLNNRHHLTVTPAGQASPGIARPRMHRSILTHPTGQAALAVTAAGIPYTILDSTAYMVSTRVLIANGDGTMLDYSSQAGYNWIDSIEIDANIDQPVSQLTLNLRRDIIDSSGIVYSLSPLRTDSVLNVNAAMGFAPAVDVDRPIQVLVATTAPGVAPVLADWQNIFTGTIDTVDVGPPSMAITARDLGGALVDASVLPSVGAGGTATSGPLYGSTAGVPMETVMQQILDDWMGVGVVELYTPVSPNYLITPFTQSLQSVSDALVALAGIIGWDIRYVWDPITLAWRLTLQTINRTQTTPDRTLQPNRYLEVTQLQIANTDVRNIITVWYQDSVSGLIASVTVQNSASIAQYGARTMVVDESTGVSPINTSDQATAFANNMLTDLAAPLADQIIVEHFDWTVFLNALQLYKANGIHYNTDQLWAVISYKHNISATQARTTVEVRGAPCGRYLNWLSLASLPGTAAPTPTLENFRIVTEDDFSVTYGWTLGAGTAQVWANSQIFASPIPDDPFATVATGVEPLSDLTYVIEKPPAGSFTYAQIEPRAANLLAGDVQRVVLTPGQAPLSFGASPQGTVSVDSNGNWSASIDGPQQSFSYRWLASTSGYPADATVQTSGTVVNGSSFTITDGGTLSFGQTIYLTAVPYPSLSAGGDAGVSLHIRGSYQSYSGSKTAYYGYSGFFAQGDQTSRTVAIAGGQNAICRYAPNTVVPAAPAFYENDFTLPSGVTITGLVVDLYYNDAGFGHPITGLSFAVVRSPGIGTAVVIASGSATNLLGWQSITTGVVSELTTGNQYEVLAEIAMSKTAAGTTYTNAGIGGFAVTYTMPNPLVTL